MNEPAESMIKNKSSKSYTYAESLELILNTVEEIFLFIDRDLNVITTNLHTREMVKAYFGFNVVDGMNVLMLAPPHRHEELVKIYTDTFKGISHKTEIVLSLDGSEHYFENHFKPARNKEGDIVGAVVTTREISEYKQAEIELKKSNDRYLFVSRATSDAIYDLDIHSKHLLWSEGMHTLFGFAPEMVTLSRWEGLVHPDDRQRVIESLNNSFKINGQKYWQEEYRFSNAAGQYKYVLDRGFVLRDENGNATRMIGSMQDISIRKNNEQLLSLERSIFELSTNPNHDFKFTIASLLKGFESIYSDAYTAVVTLVNDNKVESLITHRLEKNFLEEIHGLGLGIADGPDFTFEVLKQPVITKNFETDPLWKNIKHLAIPRGLKSGWFFPVLNSSGKLMGYFAIYFKSEREPTSGELNIAERIRNIIRILMEHFWSLNEIRLANERFDIVMRATHDMIWDWDLETNLIYRSQVGLEKVLGIKDNSSIEGVYQWLERIHPKDYPHVEKVINAILSAREQKIFEVEYRFKRDDGTYSHVYDRGMIIRNSENRPVRMIGAAQDITERKRLEKELLQNELERQKAINQASVDTQEQERSEIGKELHDNVNQVLTTTKLYLDLAISNPELKDELIKKSNNNINSVINEIRQLSRSLMDPSIGDLGLIDSINDLVENLNLTRKIHVSLSVDKKIEGSLNKNQKLTIFRIIQEALNNAIRHARAKNVKLDLRSSKNKINLVIDDDGVGFNPSLVKKGAGLKNIQNRTYLVNGMHTIKSAPGQGCKIIINFPITTKN